MDNNMRRNNKLYNSINRGWIVKVAALLITSYFSPLISLAQPKLPGTCEASRPKFNNLTVKESEVNAFMSKGLNSGNWGAFNKYGGYWVVWSDRSHNTTYSSPSATSAKCGELKFNEEVRIAKIQNGFALVYQENQKGSRFPIISNSAISRGWVSMKNLLLWESCPTNDAGIYQKALLVNNIDKTKDKADIGKCYTNPATRDGASPLRYDMRFYFIMKKADNGLVLLAKEAQLSGKSSAFLYGWVNPSQFSPWSQRTCLEPNWKPDVMDNLKGKKVSVMKNDGVLATSIELGRTNEKVSNPMQKYRFDPDVLRYPLLGNEANRYLVTAFAGKGKMPSGNTSDLVKSVEDLSNINLILVIDGTESMGKFYEPAKQIIKRAYDYFGRDNRTVKAGVVIYRDYQDGQYVTEHLSLRSATDPAINQFLTTGGNYGVKNSPNDHTSTEALYKGLEVALDTKTMGYSRDNSNLIFVIGDCGNAPDDKSGPTQESIIEKCVKNRIQLSAFQVRNLNEQSYNLFRLQMATIIRKNMDQQYAQINDGSFTARFKETSDGRIRGYDFVVEPKSKEKPVDTYFLGCSRNAPNGEEIDITRLYDLVKNASVSFNAALQLQIDNMVNAADILSTSYSTVEANFLKSRLKPEVIQAILSNAGMTAFEGYVNKQDPSNGLDYWQPVIYISSDEFKELMGKFALVNSGVKASGTDNRKPYVDAMMELTRSMIPDITPEEMGKKDIGEIMALVNGLNVKTSSLSKYTLLDIQNEKKVKPEEFDGILAYFEDKYAILNNILSKEYPFSIERFDGQRWYWIPVEDLP
jgi:hypothetical protein